MSADRTLSRHQISRKILLRIPALSYSAMDACCGDVKRQRAHLAATIDLPHVSEAIYLASPTLYRDIEDWRPAPESLRGRQIELSLTKYVARMASVPTPFGIFCGVATGQIGDSVGHEGFAIAAAAFHRRHTNVEGRLLSGLERQLVRLPRVHRRLFFRPNTSLALVRGEYHYIEWEASSGVGRTVESRVAKVESTPYFLSTISRARTGARLQTLAKALVDDHKEITLEEASVYVRELADAQILVPDFGIEVTGAPPIDSLIRKLGTAGLREVGALLSEIKDDLEELDNLGIGLPPVTYTPVLRKIERLLTFGAGVVNKDICNGRVFQVTLSMATVEPATLGNDVAVEVLDIIDLLSRALPPRVNLSLLNFRRAFRDRWGDREVPLVEVLDYKVGIGFEVPADSNDSPSQMRNGISEQPGWLEYESWLKVILERARRDAVHEVFLDAQDFHGLHLPKLARQSETHLPDAFGAVIRLQRSNGAIQVWLQSVSGPSGVRLYGRFCHADEQIDAAAREHIDKEASLYPDVILAEVVHLPHGRLVDILCRPVLRTHEIVYLGLGGADAERQLLLDDLLISVHEEIVLRSRRLGVRVLPRLTCAHRLSGRELCAYRFLVALQEQGVTPVGWSWGTLTSSLWLPRIRVGRIVLAREQWTLDDGDVEMLTEAWLHRRGDMSGNKIFATVQELRVRRDLPRYVSLLNGNTEEFVDLDHRLLVGVLVQEVVTRGCRQLAEVFPQPDSTVVTGPCGGYPCEVVLTFVRENR
jgi:lantibiotic biosynthesis protein